MKSLNAVKKTVLCQVKSIERLTPFVFQVLLVPEIACPFKAGQYVNLVMPDGGYRTFSLANSHPEEKLIELHIGATPDNAYTWEVIEHLKAHREIQMTLPEGDAYLRSAERPLLVIVGGTGFSYGWSIAQAHLASDSQQPLHFYWGARRQGDLYAHSRLLDLAQKDTRFHYIPALEFAPQAWAGFEGLVLHAVQAKVKDIENWDVYTAGRFEMVRVIRDALFEQGLPSTQLYSDALPFLED